MPIGALSHEPLTTEVASLVFLYSLAVTSELEGSGRIDTMYHQ